MLTVSDKITKIVEYLKANEGNLLSTRDLKKYLHFVSLDGRPITKVIIDKIASEHSIKIKWNTKDKNRDVFQQEKIIINYVREHNELGILMTELKKELGFYLYRGRGIARTTIENLSKKHGIPSVNWKTKFTRLEKNRLVKPKKSTVINIVDWENHPNQILIF